MVNADQKAMWLDPKKQIPPCLVFFPGLHVASLNFLRLVFPSLPSTSIVGLHYPPDVHRHSSQSQYLFLVHQPSIPSICNEDVNLRRSCQAS